jgi:Tfp pilus assembly protein PilO
MSQSGTKVAAGKARVRARLIQIRKTRRQGALGLAEIIGLAVAGFTVLLVLVGYFYFLAPAQSRLNAAQLERDRLKKQVSITQDQFTKGLGTKATVEKITESLNNFENVRLIERNGGRMLLYEDLNQLIARNGLRNTAGPTYTTLEPLGTKSAAAAAAAASNTAATKWQSVYPGIAVNVTVEGPYPNVRHFVRDIESGKQFIIINAVELERATESNTSPTESGKPANGLVSLRLDLAVYFQKAGAGIEPAAGSEAR